MRAPNQQAAGSGQDGREAAAGCSFLSPEKDVTTTARLAAVVAVLGVTLSLAAQCARADIISYQDENGRRIFVNTADSELHQAAVRGGASKALKLMERRKRSLTGIERHIETEASQHGIDPELVHAVIEVESGWNHRAVSRKGAIGLMQLLPETGARFGVHDLVNPKENVSGGIRYLRFLLDRFQNNLELALAGYNAGENAVAAAGGVPPYRETRDYLERLRTLYRKLGKGHAHGAGSIYPVRGRDGRVVFVNE